MFTQCDVIKHWVQRFFTHKVTSKFGATLFAMASHQRVIRCQHFTILLSLLLKLKFVVLCRYIIKTLLLY